MVFADVVTLRPIKAHEDEEVVLDPKGVCDGPGIETSVGLGI